MTRKKAAGYATLMQAYLAYWAPGNAGTLPCKRTAKRSAKKVSRSHSTGKHTKGVHVSTIYRARDWALAQGLPCRRTGRSMIDRLGALKVYAMYLDISNGMAKTTAAKVYGVHASTIYDNLHLFTSGELAKLVAKEATAD